MMSLSLPDWMPLWAQLVLLAVLIVFGLGFLMMPFAVFGVKGRLAELELLVQELHADVRAISVRLASAQGVETGSLSRDMFDRPVARSQAVVEEIRPPAPVPAPSAPPVAPVLTSVRAPKVSDAYEPRNEAPPMPQASAEAAGLSARRMPWHDQAAQTVYPEGRTEPLANVIRRDRAPDANQPPYRPDFSKDRDEPQGHRRYDAQTGRTEPMLNWPANTKPSL